MAEFRIIQEKGNHSLEIAQGDSLEEVISMAAEMEGLKA